jgi:hypothetical protein
LKLSLSNSYRALDGQSLLFRQEQVVIRHVLAHAFRPLEFVWMALRCDGFREAWVSHIQLLD